MSPVAIAALGRRQGRYSYLVYGATPPVEAQLARWLGHRSAEIISPLEQRLYEVAFRAGWEDAIDGRQRAAQRLDPLEDS